MDGPTNRPNEIAHIWAVIEEHKKTCAANFKWSIGIVVLIMTSIGGVFVTAHSDIAAMDQRIAGLRYDFDQMRQAEATFQVDTRGSIDRAQIDMRAATARLQDILTDLRIKLDGKNIK